MGNNAGPRVWNYGVGGQQSRHPKLAQSDCGGNFLFLQFGMDRSTARQESVGIPAATLALLIPFFFASYVVEYLVIKFMLGMPEGGPANLAYPRIRKAVRNANLITYGAMFVTTAVWLVMSLPRR
jgi:hypothetical protein